MSLIVLLSRYQLSNEHGSARPESCANRIRGVRARNMHAWLRHQAPASTARGSYSRSRGVAHAACPATSPSRCLTISMSNYFSRALFHDALSYDSPLTALSNHCVFYLLPLTQHYWS
jgi:hypothetical protein